MNSAQDASALAAASQRRASDPEVSAFVAASAGSGKTKVLTDRLLRLMLAGAAPGRIQCLTYTRAAAAEMRVRLQTLLGRWVALADAPLDEALAALGLSPDAELRRQARELFARVLDVPGGMRIETIHAFCAGLLRRFPLEAALPPRFAVLGDAEAGLLREAALTATLENAPAEALALVARRLKPDPFRELLGKLEAKAPRLAEAADAARVLETVIARQRALLGISDGETSEAILRDAMAALDLPRMREMMRGVLAHASTKLAPRVQAALDWLAAAPTAPEAWHGWAGYFLRADGKLRAPGGLISAGGKRALPGLEAEILAERDAVEAVLARLARVEIAELSAALARLGLPIAWDYARRKRAASCLDYGDLIEATLALLADPGAAWVLYKLDGGLDHLLIDEAQDTSPAQWRIADALTGEFFAGEGARAVMPARSLFAVGDHKQSIFSFQGASPEAVRDWHEQMRTRVTAAGQAFRDVALQVSFRSTTPVLALTDAVFAEGGPGLGLDEAAPRHIAHRAESWGRVELWPRLPRFSEREMARAAAEQRKPVADGGEAALAEALADQIAAMLRAGTELPSRGRALRAGDIMVLLRTRGAFPAAFVRRLRDHQVAVAGPDRMQLTTEPAVADVLALIDALLLPEDELAFATFLTSPLGGLSDADLLALALNRAGTLREALRDRADEAPGWRAAHDFFAALLARADFVTPHALLAMALGPLGGQARLLARFGAQAREAIGELLDEAFAYAQANPPSLQGFVQALRAEATEIKQEPAGAGNAVRVMTVHAAKGLQAPLVILQASTGLGRDREGGLVSLEDGELGHVPFWAPGMVAAAPALAAADARRREAACEEHYRALYVALTRAEDWLIVSGFEPGKKQPESWYAAVEAGFRRLPAARAEPLSGWVGERLVLEARAGGPAAATPQKMPAPAVAALPAWLREARPPPPEPARPARLAPSRPEGVALGEVPGSALKLLARDAAGRRFARGKLVHTLLQHLPALPEAEWADAAMRLARQSLPPEAAAALVAEIGTILNDPRLSPLFGPGSRAEAPITGVIETADGPFVVGGVIDRLAVTPRQVLIADYKTNRDPPRTAEEIPVLYRRQMQTYARVLARIYPGRDIVAALIWTRTGRIDFLDDAAL